MAKKDDKLSAEDLAMVKEGEGVPDFLDDLAPTAEEEAYLEADRLGKTDDGPATEEKDNAEAEAAEKAEAAEAGVLGEDEAKTSEDGEESQDDEPEPDEGGGKSDMVPHGALHKERARRKEETGELKAELATVKEQLTRGDERVKALMELLQGRQADKDKPKEEEDPEPNPEDDIFAHNAWLRRQLARVQEHQSKTDETISQGRQQQQSQQEQAELVRSYQTAAQQFAAEHADFGDAYTHLMNSRIRELQMLGESDTQKMRARLQEEEMAIASYALQNDRNPGEILYTLAKERGYQPKAAGADKQNGADKAAGQNGAGKLAEEAKPNGHDKSADEKISALKKGQDASMTLSSAGGSDAAELTMAALADMNDDEFSEFVEKHGIKTVNQVLGQ